MKFQFFFYFFQYPNSMINNYIESLNLIWIKLILNSVQHYWYKPRLCW